MKTTVDTRQLVESIGDAVVVSDPKGLITLWNAGAERIFGFSENEALGKSLDLIVPQKLQHRHWEGYEKTMQTGQTKYGTDLLRVPAVHKDGRALSIAFTVALLHDAGNHVSGIVAVIRDETTRFADERNLRKRVTELEGQLSARGGST
jgi:PAS domain S-box-containing protein